MQRAVDLLVEYVADVDRIRPLLDQAAKYGLYEAVVHEFQGSAACEDTKLGLLFVLLGPKRDDDEREELERFGVKEYALRILQGKLVPFKVEHRWEGSTNINKIVLSWK